MGQTQIAFLSFYQNKNGFFMMRWQSRVHISIIFIIFIQLNGQFSFIKAYVIYTLHYIKSECITSIIDLIYPGRLREKWYKTFVGILLLVQNSIGWTCEGDLHFLLMFNMETQKNIGNVQAIIIKIYLFSKEIIQKMWEFLFSFFSTIYCV